MQKPLLIFDGDCTFCRKWIVRWRSLTGDTVDYLPSQSAASQHPDISASEFARSVQFLDTDGARYSGAEAVFMALDYGGYKRWLWAYRRIPGFQPLSEWLYSIVAGHRPFFSKITTWVWGNPGELASYRQVRWLFLRGLALVYGIAFASLAFQIRGLLGETGIFPVRLWLEQLSSYGVGRFWAVPSLAWIGAGDGALVGMCLAGIGLSVAAFFNRLPRVTFALLWIVYLSLVSVGGDFMSFQWDALLLETGFLAIFLAPAAWNPGKKGGAAPNAIWIWLLRWLLFRLMFQSAMVKWMSGDDLWHRFTALTVHYETQPLPNPVSWYVHQLPLVVQRWSCIGMFIVEGALPFLIFTPRRPRLVAFWGMVILQLAIALTGNYAFFNLLTLVLCITLLDDYLVRPWMPSRWMEPIGESKRTSPWPSRLLALVIVFLTLAPLSRLTVSASSSFLMRVAAFFSPLRSFNRYGLFAVMTPTRPELIVEGSNDQKTWRAYTFRYKPGNLAARPKQAAPFQPRLDWQMWFAALSDYRQNRWFLGFCSRLLEGSPFVLDLLADNPFPETPPLYLRVSVYEYYYTTPEERRATGHWWKREYKGQYCPVLSLKSGRT